MKIFLFALLLMSGYCTIAQSELDERISKLVDSLKLSDKKLEKLERIRVQEGAMSEKWTQAYAKWDKSNSLDTFPVREEVLALSKELNLVGFIYRSGYGLGSDYIVSLMDQLYHKQLINAQSYKFYSNVLRHQGDSSSFEIQWDVEVIKSHLEEDGKMGGVGMNDYRKMNQFVASNFPNWLGLEIRSLYDSIVSMSNEQLDLLTLFCESEGMYSTQFKRLCTIPYLSTETGRDFYTNLRSTHVLNNYRFGLSENWAKLINPNNVKWKPFYEDTSIRLILIGNMLYQQLVDYELEVFNRTKFGQLALNSTGKNASFWYALLESEFLSMFRFMKMHDNTGSGEIYEFMSAMQNGIYFQFISGRDDNTAQYEKLSIADLDLSVEQRRVIDDFIKNGRILPENHYLIEKEVVNTSWQQNIHFRMALYLANLKCAHMTASDWYMNPVKENPFDGSLAVDRNKSDQADLDRMKTYLYERLQVSGVTFRSYTLITNMADLVTCFPYPSEFEQRLVRGILHDMYRDFHNGVNYSYYRFVIDMNQMREAQNKVQPILEEVRVESKGERVAVEVRSVMDKQIAVTPPPAYEMYAYPNLEIIPEIVEFPDVEASFPDGARAMKEWITANMVYPEISRELGDQGRVYVSFVVEADGSITGIEVPRSLTTELDREAKRLVREMPKWTPGLVKGEKVRSRCRIPITFTLP